MNIVPWGPHGGVEVKARGEAYVFGAAGDVELGVGLYRWRAGQAGFWKQRTWPSQEIGLLSTAIY